MDHMDHSLHSHAGHDSHEGHDMDNMHDDPCAHASHGHAMVGKDLSSYRQATSIDHHACSQKISDFRHIFVISSGFLTMFSFIDFHSGVCQEILFSGWMATNALELFGSAVAIFFAGVLYEGLKYFREALHARASASTGDSRVNITKSECGANGSCGGTAVVKYSMLSSGHVIQTLLHFLQSTASYTLMLVFMTYNVWLCLALVLGLAVGYFFFGWRKNTVVDVNEHCQ